MFPRSLARSLPSAGYAKTSDTAGFSSAWLPSAEEPLTDWPVSMESTFSLRLTAWLDS